MKHLGLFEGIGGFSLAARWAGWETVAWCEWNEFGQRVLRHHFPEAEGYGDITQTSFTKYNGTVDIITGGFPCQPYSMAGKRKGKDDNRHLWPSMLRVIREVQPRWVVGENVFGLINWNGGLVFDEVQADLEAEGYEVWSYVLPACAKDAPHRRDRLFIVAYSNGSRSNRKKKHENCEKNSGNWKQSNYINNDGKIWKPTPDTDSDGQHQCHSNDEINASEGRQYAQRDVKQGDGDGPTPDTDIIAKNTMCGRCVQREFEQERTEVWEQRNIGTGGSDGLHISERNAADTDLQRCNKLVFTTFTNKQERQYSEKNIRSQSKCWQDFPTQSPICGGDDGLPCELDGITFSKWRQESIKAYGNAIVPQVAYELFKIINQIEKCNTT